MFKKIAMLSSLATLGLSACSPAASDNNVEVVPIPQPVAEATIVERGSHTTTETKPMFGAPTIAPGYTPYTTTTSTTEYYLVVSYDEGNAHTQWVVTEHAFNNCFTGYKAVKYDNGFVVCSSSSETENDESSENPTEPVEEEPNEPAEEITTVPNGFAKDEEETD